MQEMSRWCRRFPSPGVENDPARAEVTGELVPSNYNAPTPPPADVTSTRRSVTACRRRR
ncbi:MAG: hypothetical protein ACLSAH_15900 [Bilophila wadsworthia]